MAELSDAEYKAASERGAIAYATEPRAIAARFDPADERIVVDLANGATFAFPARLGQGLEQATPNALADIEISPSGFGLHWPQLDADLSVRGLLAGRFGTPAYMADRFGSDWNAVAAE